MPSSPSRALLLAGAVTGAISAGISPVYGQSPDGTDAPVPLDAEEIVITATRSERALDDISRSVSVVDQFDIKRLNAPSALDILRELPGISAAPDGGLGGQLVIRGFSTQGFRAPLFLDGDRVRGRNTLEFNLFNPDEIERIEVVRGPASSLYGTDSFGGVINIITKRATADPEGPWRLTDSALFLDYATTNSRHGGRVQLGAVGQGFDVLVGGNFQRAYDYGSPLGEIPNSGFEAPSFDGKLGYTFAPGHRIEIQGRWSDIYRERAGGQFAAPGALNPPGVPQRRQTDRALKEVYTRLAYSGESLFNGMLRDVEATVYRRDLDTTVNVVPDARNPSTFVDVFVVGPTVWGGHYNGVIPLTDELSATIGGDWYFEERAGGFRSVRGGPRTPRAPDSEQLAGGGFLLLEWQPHERVKFDGSVRVDRVRTSIDTGFILDDQTRELFAEAGDRINTPVTGSAGVIVDVTSWASLFGNFSTAFRAPSVTELTAVGTGVNPVFRLPNPGVEPEKALNVEGGLRLRQPRWEVDLVGFINNLDNLIDRNAPATFEGMDAVQIQNIGEAKLSGIEANLSVAPTLDWLFRSNVTWTRGTDELTGDPLPQIMPLAGRLSGRWQPAQAGYYAEAAIEWAVERDRVDPAQERPRDGYAILNLYAGAELQQLAPQAPDVTIRLSLENVLNDAYRLPTTPEEIGFPISPTNPLVQPGRNLIVGLEYRF